jgi:hypothetical protein
LIECLPIEMTEDLDAALERAIYERIEYEEPFYAEIPGVQGVWATGRSPEECRRNLAGALEDWVLCNRLPMDP